MNYLNIIVGEFTSTILMECHLSTNNTFLERARALQKQIHLDLDHAYFTGIRTLRELTRLYGTRLDGAIPVVFTSGLGLNKGALDFLGEKVYFISQTSQVS